jgi:hypothetical protein
MQKEVCAWMPGMLAHRGLLHGKRAGIIATPLEASAARCSILCPSTGKCYDEFRPFWRRRRVSTLPTREYLARLDRKCKKCTSNKEKVPQTGSPNSKDERRQCTSGPQGLKCGQPGHRRGGGLRLFVSVTFWPSGRGVGFCDRWDRMCPRSIEVDTTGRKKCARQPFGVFTSST